MNLKQIAQRVFSLFSANRIVTPEGNTPHGFRLIGTNGASVNELIKKNEAFEYNTGYVYSCVNKNAMVISASRLRLFAMSSADSKGIRTPHLRLKGEDKARIAAKAVDSRIVGGIELDELFDHPFLDLMREPYEMGTYQQLLANTQTGQELQGDNLWVITFDPRLGTPDSVHSVPIHRVEIVLNKNGSIEHYLVNLGEKKVIVPPKAALHFKMPPSYDYFGTSPLTAASLSTKLFNNTLIYETSLAENSAIPMTLIKYTGGTLSRDDTIQLESDWNSTMRGLRKTGRAKVMDEMFEVEQLALSPRELQFLAGRKMLREDICNVYGVPVTLFTSEANLASAKTAIDIYNLFAIEPRLQTLQQTINTRINEWYPEAGGRLFVVLENQVSLKDEAIRHNLVFTATAQEIITREEARHLLNLGE